MSNPKGNVHTLKPFAPKWRTGKTRTIRVPIDLADQLLDLAHALDNREHVFFAYGLKEAIERICADPIVTRGGRDRGAIKRGLNALLGSYEWKHTQPESRAL